MMLLSWATTCTLLFSEGFLADVCPPITYQSQVGLGHKTMGDGDANGCGSKPMVPFWARCSTHFSPF